MGLWSALKAWFQGPPPGPPFFGPDGLPAPTRQRLAATKSGVLPWVSTMTPAELSLTRTHGIEMVGAITASCWMRFGRSWTEGHAQGWRTALARLRAEARALGAHAVLDVRMITVVQEGVSSGNMNFSLSGTAVRFKGQPLPAQPVVATVPAIEFIELLDAGITPVGIAIGARYDWSPSGMDIGQRGVFQNRPLTALTQFWERLRRQTHADLRADAARQGTGVLAQVQFQQLIGFDEGAYAGQCLGRHIVLGTVVRHDPARPVPQDIDLVIDMQDKTPLTTVCEHHDAYREGI